MECVTCVCVWLGAVGCGGEGGGWMRELGLGFTNPVGTGGVLDVCPWLGCGDVGGVGGGVGRVGAVEWCYICVRCESGISV